MNEVGNISFSNIIAFRENAHIDLDDKLIRAAGPRIKEKRGFVISPEIYSDNNGHGTHVARLLLKVAPSAEIFVAKITNDKDIDLKDMSRIAEVSLFCL